MTLQSELARLLEARGWRIRNLGVRCWQDPLKPDGELLGGAAAVCPDCGELVTACEAKADTKGRCWRWDYEPPVVAIVENPESVGDPNQEPVVWFGTLRREDEGV